MTRAGLAIEAAREDIKRGGAAYKLGAKPALKGRLPKGAQSDCSGAVRRWLAIAGVESRDGSVRQYEECRPVAVALALGPKGAGLLLFMTPKRGHPGHVALSLGNGRTVECRGGKGMCYVEAGVNRRRKWDRAGKMGELFQTV